MKAKEALHLLGITRATLCNYVKLSYIKVTVLLTGTKKGRGIKK